jgi:hypothetical protein
MVIVVGFAAMHAARVVPRGAGAVAEESSARSSAMQSKTKSGRMSVAKSVAAGTVAVAALSCAGGAMADAVEWRVADGGNGHWYAFRVESSVICWNTARVLCETAGGHLATITSGAENQLLLALTIPNNPGGIQGGPYIGGTCEGLPWGQWYWITGEPFSFTAWMSGAPNGSTGATEPYLHFWRWSNLGWNDQVDCGGLMFSYLIEWSADCNNNGVVDFGEIRNGFAVDTNGNNIPDECECTSDPSLAICCPEDIIEDGAVNAIDLAAILNTWGTDGGKFPRADVDGSGTVDGADLAAVLSAWGPCE